MTRSKFSLAAAAALVLAGASSTYTWSKAPEDEKTGGLRAKHVLLLSIDGLHALDVDNYITAHPASALAQLAAHGLVYTQASCSKPSDSFPGLTALITGGTPAVTGIYYDVTYNGALLPPSSTGVNTAGTLVAFDESIDLDKSRVDGGGGIDATKLPRDPGTQKPIYPHQYLRVNTIFEVAKAEKLHTAWCDKHRAYDLANGPSGNGVDDLFTPEINSDLVPGAVSGAPGFGLDLTASEEATAGNDDLKVAAVINEINGKDSSGTKKAPVPAIFGMNFQAVSVAQKNKKNVKADGTAEDPALVQGGYADAIGTPSALLAQALDHTDASIGSMVTALKAKKLFESTLIIVTSKHGQGPTDVTRFAQNPENTIPTTIAPIQVAAGVGGLDGLTQDTTAYVWLQNHSDAPAAAAKLLAQQSALHLRDVLYGPTLRLLFPDPAQDAHVPDLVVIPEDGYLFYDGSKKIAEHGGFSTQETNVGLIVSLPSIEPGYTEAPVSTTQVAPTILKALGLNPGKLQAVQKQGTEILPFIFED